MASNTARRVGPSDKWSYFHPVNGLINGKSTNKWRCVSYWKWWCSNVMLDWKGVYPTWIPCKLEWFSPYLPWFYPRPSPRVAACAVEPVTGLVVLIGAKLEVWAWWLLGWWIGPAVEIGKKTRVNLRIIEPSKLAILRTKTSLRHTGSNPSIGGSKILQGTKQIWGFFVEVCWVSKVWSKPVSFWFLLKDFWEKKGFGSQDFRAALEVKVVSWLVSSLNYTPLKVWYRKTGTMS